jgi:hypothetical protein
MVAMCERNIWLINSMDDSDSDVSSDGSNSD